MVDSCAATIIVCDRIIRTCALGVWCVLLCAREYPDNNARHTTQYAQYGNAHHRPICAIMRGRAHDLCVAMCGADAHNVRSSTIIVSHQFMSFKIARHTALVFTFDTTQSKGPSVWMIRKSSYNYNAQHTYVRSTCHSAYARNQQDAPLRNGRRFAVIVIMTEEPLHTMYQHDRSAIAHAASLHANRQCAWIGERREISTRKQC